MEDKTSVSAQIKRKKLRYHSKAQAYIKGVLENAVVKDISITGCCLICDKPVEIKLHEMYVIHVLPEDTTGLGKIELLTESRWIKTRGNYHEIGFWIISSPMVFSQYKYLCRKRLIK